MRSNHCAISDCESKIEICSEYLFVYIVMSSLLDQINEAEGSLQSLLDGIGELTERERLCAQSLQAKLASLRPEAQSIRDICSAEAKRGEMRTI